MKKKLMTKYRKIPRNGEKTNKIFEKLTKQSSKCHNLYISKANALVNSTTFWFNSKNSLACCYFFMCYPHWKWICNGANRGQYSTYTYMETNSLKFKCTSERRFTKAKRIPLHWIGFCVRDVCVCEVFSQWELQKRQYFVYWMSMWFPRQNEAPNQNRFHCSTSIQFKK